MVALTIWLGSRRHGEEVVGGAGVVLDGGVTVVVLGARAVVAGVMVVDDGGV
jgi:hypothetical protein